MLARFLKHICQCAVNFENNLSLFFGGRYPPDAFCALTIKEHNSIKKPKASFSIHDLLNDSILWAVPKSRRSLEKRLNRKFGWPNQVWKPLVPKKNLLMCQSCGDHYVAGHLCPSCYSKVKKETEEMVKTIEAELQLNPVDKEVVVLYKGEKEGVPDEFHQGKRIIEMAKERPQWFSKNLMERTTKGLATTTSVKPTDLA